jgi:hypothetical protein
LTSTTIIKGLRFKVLKVELFNIYKIFPHPCCFTLVNASYSNSEVQKVEEINKWTIDTKLLKVGE